MSVPDGAACWICLDEGPDAHGRPLVRDCSCRGNGAGFAHFSCLVQYARRKTTESVEKGLKDMRGFRQPWETCFNCGQRYQGDLSLGMSNAFVLFAKKNYDHPGNDSGDKMKVIDALRIKIESAMHLMLGGHNNTSVEEMAQSDLKEMLERVEHLQKTARMASWIHEPRDSSNYRNYKLLRQNYESFAYRTLGILYSLRLTKHDRCIAMKHYKKALTIYKILDAKDEAVRLESAIANIESAIVNLKEVDCKEKEDRVIDAQFVIARDGYKYARKTFGENSEQTIRNGLIYAEALGNFRRVESERLRMRLLTRSRRIHGPEHEITKFAEFELKQCNGRVVAVLPLLPEIKYYQLLRYEDDKVNCVVKGPIAKPRDAVSEETFTIPSSQIIPDVGCPVTCHGLTSAPNLNGKIGEVRRLGVKRGVRCAIHFEDESLKPASVKPENLWVIIEFPQKEIE